MKALFISRKRPDFEIMPFVRSQEESLNNLGVETDHFVVRDSGMLGYLKSIPKLRKKIKSSDFDILHAHYGYTGWLALLTFSGIPVVVSLMGSDVYGTTTRKLKNHWRIGLRGRIEITITKLLQFFATRIIVKSKNLFDGLYLKKRSDIIPNGVDFQKFKPEDMQISRQQLNLPTDPVLILFLGHPSYTRKNFALLETAAKMENNVDWEIINPYPTDPVNVPGYINAANVVVLTSYREGSPNVIKEAMACGRPIVSTDVGDVKEIIQNTEGCYITSHDVTDLVDNLNRAVQFGKRTTGRKDIEHLEINRIAQKIISVYEKALNRHS